MQERLFCARVQDGQELGQEGGGHGDIVRPLERVDDLLGARGSTPSERVDASLGARG